MSSSRISWLGLLLFSTLVGCTVKVDSPNVAVNGNIKFPTCTAVGPVTTDGKVAADTDFLVEVTAAEGLAPYSISGTSLKFASTTSVTRQLENNTSADLVVEDWIEVKDSLGLPGSCSYTVTVKPKTVAPGTLACAMTSSNDSPHINEPINLTATASGGSAMYTFSGLTLGIDGVVVSALAQTPTYAVAAVKYTSAGSKTINISLNDGTSTISCVKTINVRPAVSVALVAVPPTVSADGSMTITATPSGFASTPTYSFYTNDPYVNIVTNGNVATLTSSISSGHSFYIAVTASQGGESAFASIPVSFSAVTPLSCTLGHPSGTYRVNDTVVYTMTSNTNEAVTIVSFDAGINGTVSSSTTSSRSVKYSTSGAKWASATGKVRRGSVDVLCNAGSALWDTVTIGSTLSCNIVSSPNPSYVDEYYTQIFDVSVTVPSGAGSTNPRIISLSSTGSTYGISTYSNTGNLTRQAYFSEAGSFTVKATIQDDSGSQATCSTSHISSWWSWWWY